MDNYEIVPYQPEHGEFMIEFGLNDKLMDGDAQYEENRIDFATPGIVTGKQSRNYPSDVTTVG